MRDTEVHQILVIRLLSVQFSLSVMSDSLQPHWTAKRQASLSITNSWSLLKLISIKSVMPSNHLILCRPLFLLPSFFPSIRVFSSESVLCIRWPKYWSFSFNINSSKEYSGLISFRIHWLGFPCGLACKETACNARDVGLIPGLGRSPGEGATHSSILAWRIPWNAWRIPQYMGLERVVHN